MGWNRSLGITYKPVVEARLAGWCVYGSPVKLDDVFFKSSFCVLSIWFGSRVFFGFLPA